MNAMQKIVDAGLATLLIILIIVGGVAIVREHRTRPLGGYHVGGPVTRFSYSPGAFLGCDVGPGPTWEMLQTMAMEGRP